MCFREHGGHPRCRSSRTWPRWPLPSRPPAATRAATRTRPPSTLDQAAAFLDKQTKGKYSGQVSGVVGKAKSAAGLPQNSGTQGYETNAGYGAHAGYGGSAVASTR